MDKKKEFTEYERKSMARMNLLINEYCGGSQQRFAERTGLSKGAISQYVNGRNVPSNITAKRIAEAFHVDPAWLMGFDVEDPKQQDLTTEAIELYEEYQSLSPENQIAFRTLLKSLRSDS